MTQENESSTQGTKSVEVETPSNGTSESTTGETTSSNPRDYGAELEENIEEPVTKPSKIADGKRFSDRSNGVVGFWRTLPTDEAREKAFVNFQAEFGEEAAAEAVEAWNTYVEKLGKSKEKPEPKPERNSIAREVADQLKADQVLEKAIETTGLSKTAFDKKYGDEFFKEFSIGVRGGKTRKEAAETALKIIGISIDKKPSRSLPEATGVKLDTSKPHPTDYLFGITAKDREKYGKKSI